jgi:tRNA1(Val) A37 N6-methylase TrmN6
LVANLEIAQLADDIQVDESDINQILNQLKRGNFKIFLRFCFVEKKEK